MDQQQNQDQDQNQGQSVTVEHQYCQDQDQSATVEHQHSYQLSNLIGKKPSKYLSVKPTEMQTKLMQKHGISLTHKQRKTLYNLKMGRLPTLPNATSIRSLRRERSHGRRNNDPINYSASGWLCDRDKTGNSKNTGKYTCPTCRYLQSYKLAPAQCNTCDTHYERVAALLL